MKITEIISEDWNKVNKQDKTDGLSKKAVKAYRRENPGSKLQTAVTTKPSKLKAGSKAAKRRKSFCARMSGNKGPMKKPNGKPTPKALALRRWNCESIEEMRQLIENAERVIREEKQKGVDGKACWDGYKRMGTKKKGGKTVDNCVKVGESATAGATSTANIGTVVNPHISPGKARGKKSYLGDPWGGKSGTKSPPQPKVVQPKNPDGTAKGAHEVKGASLFGGPTVKRR